MGRSALLFYFIVSALASVNLWASVGSGKPANRGLYVQPAFEVNVGQALYTDRTKASHVDAMLVTRCGNAYIHPGGIHFALSRLSKGDAESADVLRTDFTFVGANPRAHIVRSGETQDYIRYMTSPKSGGEGLVAKRHSTILYRDVWNGIDVRMNATNTGVKIDYIVHPGANPNDIAVRIDGALGTSISNGELNISTALGNMTEGKPFSYTSTNVISQISTIASSYKISGNTVRFDVGNYDRSKILVIDPKLAWATYFGFNQTMGTPKNTVDADGYVFIAGSTLATNLPKIAGTLQKSKRAGQDAYVARFRDDGEFMWCTYMGGNGAEKVNAAATDKNGNVYICGRTTSDYDSLPFQAVGSAPFGDPPSDSAKPAVSDGFVFALTKKGAEYDHWYYFGRDDDEANDIVIRDDFMAVIGSSSSDRICERAGVPFAHNAALDYYQSDIWVCRIRYNTGSSRWNGQWISFLGSVATDKGVAVALDKDYSVFAVGSTDNSITQVTDGSTFKGGQDFVIAKFTGAPTALTPTLAWCRMIGSSLGEFPRDASLDTQGSLVVVGYTTSTAFPLTAPYRNALVGQVDGFIAKYSATGTTTFSTYFGGAGSEQIQSVAVDKANNIWIGGDINNYTTDLPLTAEAYQTTMGGIGNMSSTTQGFFACMKSDGTGVTYCTMYGSPSENPPPSPATTPPGMRNPDDDYGEDGVTSVAVEGSGAYIHIASAVQSLNMDTTKNAYQGSSKLRKDTIMTAAFAGKFSNCPDSTIAITFDGPPSICPGSTTKLVGPAGFASYKWNEADTGRTLTVSVAGTYDLVATTAIGCRYKASTTVNASVAPVIRVQDTVIMCAGKSVKLSATVVSGVSPYKYVWDRIESGPEYLSSTTADAPDANPNMPTRYQVTMTDVTGCSTKDTIFVSIMNPKPTIQSTLINFGVVDACKTTKTMTVRIVNPMSYTLTLSGFKSDLSIVNIVTPLVPAIKIKPGDYTDVEVSASPTTAGITNGTLFFTGDECDWEIGVAFTVKKESLLATVSASNISFGRSLSCDTGSVTDTIFITNNGNGSLTIQPGFIVEPGMPFRVLEPITPTVVEARESTKLIVRYKAIATGQYDATLRIPYKTADCNDSITVTLSALHAAPSLSILPATSINVGTLDGCTNSIDTAILVKNTSTVTEIMNVVVDNGLAVKNPGPYTLEAGDSVIIQLTVSPLAQGAFSYNIKVDAMPCAITSQVSISGTKEGIIVSTPSTIDFGEIEACDASSVTMPISIEFSGGASTTLTSIVVGNSVATTLLNGDNIVAGTPLNRTITWTPSSDGVFIDSLVLTFEPCNIRKVVRLTGSRTNVTLGAVPTTIDHGTVQVSANGTATFTNFGTDTLTISALETSNGIVINSTAPALPAVLLPGESIKAEYTQTCMGAEATDSITATGNVPCPLRSSTTIHSTCSKDTVLPVTAAATIRVDTITINTGDQFVLPVRIIRSSGLNSANAHSFQAVIRYHPGVVVGRGNTPDCFDGAYAPCTITLNGTRGNDTIGTITNLEFTAILGTQSSTDVELESFTWTDATVAPEDSLVDGRITIGNICTEGGERLLQSSSVGTLVLSPNPASTSITIAYTGIAGDEATIDIYDAIGMLVRHSTITTSISGTGTSVLDVSDLPSGTYAVNMSAGVSTVHSTAIIAR